MTSTWTRTSRAGLLAALVAVSLSACSGNGDLGRTNVAASPLPVNPVANASASPGATADPNSPAASTDPSADPNSNIIPPDDPKPVSSDPVKVFGKQRVDAAVQTAYDIVDTSLGMVAPLKPGSKSDWRIYDPIIDYLTPSAQTYLKQQAAAGDPNNGVWSLVLSSRPDGSIRSDKQGGYMTLVAPYVLAPQAGAYDVTAEAGVNGAPYVTVTIDSEASYIGMKNGKKVNLPLTRRFSLDLVPQAKNKWALDSWESVQNLKEG